MFSFQEYSLASLIFYSLKEGACSEQSARMSAMDNASKNASKSIILLNFNVNFSARAIEAQLVYHNFCIRRERNAREQCLSQMKDILLRPADNLQLKTPLVTVSKSCCHQRMDRAPLILIVRCFSFGLPECL